MIRWKEVAMISGIWIAICYNKRSLSGHGVVRTVFVKNNFLTQTVGDSLPPGTILRTRKSKTTLPVPHLYLIEIVNVDRIRGHGLFGQYAYSALQLKHMGPECWYL